PPVRRLPVPPPAADSDAGPATTPPPAPSAPASAGPGAGAPPAATPSAPPAASAATSPPAPTASSSGPRLIATSSQAGYGYASAPPAGPSPHRCRLLGWLCPFKKHGPFPSSQLPPATFPTSYESCIAGAGHALPTPQRSCSSCETTHGVKVKKPCFLQTWLHKTTCPGRECGCCGGGCDAHPPAVTATSQSGVPSPHWDPSYRPWVLRSAGTEPRDVAHE